MACPYPALGRDLGSPNLRPMPFLSAGGMLAQFLHCAAFNFQGLTSKPWEFGLVQSQYGGMMRNPKENDRGSEAKKIMVPK